MAKVLRILSAAALLLVVAAGCGDAARPQRAAVHGVPRALAQAWEGRASAIAAAASAGNSCHALQLATSLRADVQASKDKVPSRLRSPLLTSVNALADRIICTPPVTTGPQKPPKAPDERHGQHDDHGHHKHGKGEGGGNDQ